MQDYEDAINLQGSWGYTPTTPIMDPQAKDTGYSQLAIHCLVTQAVQNTSASRGNSWQERNKGIKE